MNTGESFRSYTPAELITVGRNSFRTAEKYGISLKLKDTIYLFDKHLPIPGKRSRKRIKKTVTALQQEAVFENTEFDEGQRLAAWLDQTALPVILSQENAGRDMLQTPVLVRQGRSGQTESLSLASVLSLPPEVSDKLDPDITSVLNQRELFWKRYGITSGPELQEFLRNNFTRRKITFEEKLPAEIEWLKAVYPEDYRFLENIAEQYNVTLVTCNQSPDRVLKNVRYIATGSQHKFVSTWLPDFVTEGLDPFVLASDRTALEEKLHIKQNLAQRIQEKNPFLGDLEESLAEDEFDKKSDFRTSMQLIRDFIPLYMSVEISNGRIDPETRKRIQEINGRLTQGIGREYALKKLLYDDAGSVSKDAQRLLKVTAFAALFAQILESYLHLPWIAKCLAAMTDDISGEAVEYFALKGIDVSNEEFRERFPALITTLIAATGAATTVETTRLFNANVAGAQYMASAVLLSLVTSILTSKYLGKGYKELAKEGKLREYYPVVPPEEVSLIKQITQEMGLTSPPEIWSGLEAALAHDTDSIMTIDEKRAAFYRFAEGKESQVIFDRLREPPSFTVMKHGVKEAMGINPTRLGVGATSLAAPGIGFVIGPAILPHPLAYAAAGALEGIGGIGTLLGYKYAFPHVWNHHVRQIIKESQENERET